MSSSRLKNMVLTAFFIALALLLPFLTGQIPQIGSMLSPMHIPVLLCGFVCGWPWGLIAGLVSPILRSFIFGMPPLMPMALAMAFELAAYGAAAGLLYRLLHKKTLSIYISLIAAMLIGRVVWGLVSIPLYAMFTDRTFALAAFWAGGFINAWPGIVLQIVLVPVIVFALEKAKLIPLQESSFSKGL